ncbi:DUF7935 family protein [Flavobacterium aurantiibacter]|uniref:Uncharacterized protein n=1 Tax=Flavobacterium aurantiibacter TaxID=2023067 RepID=A0A255ZGS6_9FLAO|nr:hypothetical protein [Flavobacterium aurantiibacter]OYQ40666.1 hypothetical protein CHX27_13385 [Flavobacterium aurantiibacter]
MNADDLLKALLNILPALIVGIVAVNFFKNFVLNQNEERRFEILRQTRKETLPLKLQAYERLTLLMDRISIAKVAVRIAPVHDDTESYVQILSATVEQEFEHNLTQQIYVSDECWLAITAAKNATLRNIREISLLAEATNADSFRQLLLQNAVNSASTTNLAINMLRAEVQRFI